jgi:hypothetical protein
MHGPMNFKQPIGPILKCQAVQDKYIYFSWTTCPFKTRKKGSETSVTNYQSATRDIL